MAPTPNDSWFYSIEDRPVGPVTEDQLRAAVSAGVVGPGTLVHHATWPGWCQAMQVAGLIDATSPQGAPSAPPSPAASLAVPPTLAASVAALPPHSAPTPAVLPTPAATAQVPPIPAADHVVPPSPGVAPAGFDPLEAPLSLHLQGGDPSRPARARDLPARRRKKNSPVVTVLLLLGAVATCAAVAAAIWLGPKTGAEPSVAQTVARPTDDQFARASRGRDWSRAPRRTEDDEYAFPEWNADAGRPTGDFHPTFESAEPPEPRGKIDELVFARWEKLGIEPANRCSDAVFLRRVYLDVIGTLPTAGEARAFLADDSPDKREKLIDELLERPEYADYWAMRWSDILRVKAEFPINLWPNAAQAYHRWIYHSMATNKPYDQFARELLTSTGSNFRNGEVNFYRALQNYEPTTIAQAAALAFMGERAEHWPEERRNGMAGFFAKVGFKPTREWKEEIVVFDPYKSQAAMFPTVFPDGTAVEIPWDQDPRVVFADWLIRPENPWFARQISNRLWYWLLGRGIVHEPDDVRTDNPPSNPELLNWLANELVQANYDMKHLCRLILNSSTYQLSPISKSDHPKAEVHFASYPVRRLEAEVIIDALNQISGTTESYSSIIPEPYTFIPETMRAIALPDGSIISSFLELFGRPPRDTGLASERNSSITAGQRLHMLNSSHIRNKLRNGPGIKALAAEGNARENLYLAILSRFPGDADQGGSGEELAWMLINTTEFLFRH